MFRVALPSLSLPVALTVAGLCHHSIRHSLNCDYSPANASGQPRSLTIKDSEFMLVASGTRKVTFLSISVYDVGLYIRTSDISALQSALRRPEVTSRDDLVAMLSDPEKGTDFFEGLNKVSFAVRITPVRNTDIAHMRDGFVRGVLLRHSPDEGSLQAFKEFFPNPRKAFLKSDVMLLTVWNGRKLDLDINGHDYGTFQGQGQETSELLRAFLGTYMSGKKVASEPLREEFIQQIAQDVV